MADSDSRTQPAKRTISVFIASPSDLAEERRAFKDVVDELNDGFAAGADTVLEPLVWEETLATYGRRSQSVINEMVDHCDCFVLALHRRWGQDAPDSDYSSYTEEEFQLAAQRFEKTGSPRIFVFLKKIDAASIADPGEQLQKVLTFRRELERSRRVIYREFAEEGGFRIILEGHLKALIKGDLPPVEPGAPVPLPVEAVAKVEKAERDAARAREAAKAAGRRAEEEAYSRKAMALRLAKSAANAARAGRVEEARQDMIAATSDTLNVATMSLGYELFLRVGDLVLAEGLVRRWIAISGPDDQTGDTAAAYGNLGVIYQKQGDLDRGEDMARKALEINERLGRQEGMASQYGNLGVIYQMRGDLDEAEAMHRKGLAIDERLGRQEGMASDYGNLALIYQTRGDLDEAEAMLRKALAINERLGRQEGMAKQYGNLGNLYKMGGNLDQAEAMLRKALAIDERLGHQEGIANAYGNLGLVEQARGDLDQAEDMYLKALAIDARLGRQEGMANAYGNLGLIYQRRRDLDQAEAMQRKALAIDERLGRKEGVANAYANLGIIYKTRGDLAKARESWMTSIELFRTIGMPQMVERVQGLLDGLLADDSAP